MRIIGGIRRPFRPHRVHLRKPFLLDYKEAICPFPYRCAGIFARIMEERKQIIDVREVLRRKVPGAARWIPAAVTNWLARTIHEGELNDILTRYATLDGVDFMQALVSEFDLKLDVHGAEHLPTPEQHCLFVSNHPLGGLDGICLSALLGARYGATFRCVVNDLLLFIPNLRSIFLPVNKHGRQRREAAAQLEAAMRGPGQVLTFPAGLCSRQSGGKIEDVAWRSSFVRDAVRYRRDVVPIFFDGRNSQRFYRAARLRERLGIRLNVEMVYLPDEMFRNKHRTFGVYIGAPIGWQTFDSSQRPSEWAKRVRDTVYGIKTKQE